MTQSIHAKPKATSDEAAHHQRLLELVEAEDSANGKVSCGQELEKGLSGYFSSRGNFIDDEKLKNLLRDHLRHILREPDFDSITTQIQHQIESVIVQSSSESGSSGFSMLVLLDLTIFQSFQPCHTAPKCSL